MCYVKGGIINYEWTNNVTENCFSNNPKEDSILVECNSM